MLGYDKFGTGDYGVVVLNDWLCDTSTWDAARPYLDQRQFSWAFCDMRGYGRSRTLRGEYNVREGAADVLATADALGWRRFAVVGHSMSTLIAMHLGQHAPERVDRVVLITPAPPAGMGVDDATLAAMEAVAAADDAARSQQWKKAWGGRLSETWVDYKVARWRERSEVAAVVRYIRMYARDGLPDPTAPILPPTFAISCEQDAPMFHRQAVAERLTPLCKDLTLASLAESGHYPMQEAPPLLATYVQRFFEAGMRPPQ
jgi:pimeloyl-ACP methyl ester carboxylesterase